MDPWSPVTRFRNNPDYLSLNSRANAFVATQILRSIGHRISSSFSKDEAAVREISSRYFAE